LSWGSWVESAIKTLCPTSSCISLSTFVFHSSNLPNPEWCEQIPHEPVSRTSLHFDTFLSEQFRRTKMHEAGSMHTRVRGDNAATSLIFFWMFDHPCWLGQIRSQLLTI
jgi:hypothetical protein